MAAENVMNIEKWESFADECHLKFMDESQIDSALRLKFLLHESVARCIAHYYQREGMDFGDLKEYPTFYSKCCNERELTLKCEPFTIPYDCDKRHRIVYETRASRHLTESMKEFQSMHKMKFKKFRIRKTTDLATKSIAYDTKLILYKSDICLKKYNGQLNYDWSKAESLDVKCAFEMYVDEMPIPFESLIESLDLQKDKITSYATITNTTSTSNRDIRVSIDVVTSKYNHEHEDYVLEYEIEDFEESIIDCLDSLYVEYSKLFEVVASDEA